jgi:hypothetical protein
MTVEIRPLKRDAAEIYAEALGFMNQASRAKKPDDFDKAWKIGVLELVAKIAHELEIARGHA